MAVERPLVRPPEFPSVEWLNTPAPLTLAQLRGQVVLVDVFDFTCLNCLRALPVLRDWHHRYQESGLVTLGVHTPEFRFARDRVAVQRALGRLGIRWPVALDNDDQIWTALATQAWPTVYLIDRAGFIRSSRLSEDGDAELETAFRTLLAEGPPPRPDLPEPLLSGGEFRGGSLPMTSELHSESIGNGPLEEEKPARLTLPDSRPEGAFYLAGEWRLDRRGLTLESGEGEIVLPFRAGAVHAVMAARREDPVGDRGDPAWLETTLDLERVEPGRFGQDLLVRQGATWLRVDAARSYNLLQALGPGPHELRLRCVSPGTTVYAFAFEAHREPAPTMRSEPC